MKPLSRSLSRFIGPCLLAGLTLGLAACGGGSPTPDNVEISSTPTAESPPAARMFTQVVTVAGSAESGSRDSGTAPVTFDMPLFVAADAGANLYVADTNNHKIRKILPNGQVITLAGSGASGSTNGSGTDASFNHPRGMAVDKRGNVYVVDHDNHKIRKISPRGEVSTVAGSGAQGAADGTGTAATFTRPAGIAVDDSGTLYVADTYGHKIRKITAAGVVSTVAGSGVPGATDGTGLAATLNGPVGIAVDPAGTTLYVGDSGSHKVRKIVLATAEVSTLVGSGAVGAADGIGAAATFYHPEGVALDASGTQLYVVDHFNNKVRQVALNTLAVTTVAGSGSRSATDATGTAASFNRPFGVAVGTAGQIYVADSENHKIRQISPQGEVSTWAGSGTAGSQDTGALFGYLGKVAIDTNGNAYVADPDNHKIRKITPDGTVSTFAGTGVQGRRDGDSTTAQFDRPWGMAVDKQGNVYVSDLFAHNIRMITPSGTVSTLAGSGPEGEAQSGDVDGVGTAARFDGPSSLAINARGTLLYVADFKNKKVRKIDLSSGAVNTLAGASTSNTFSLPYDLTVDAEGNVYVADLQTRTLHKVTAAGAVSTLVQIDVNLSGITTGSDGLLYALSADLDSNSDYRQVIRKITTAGQVSTLAGPGLNPFEVLDGPLNTASFGENGIQGIAADPQGRLYVTNRYQVRRIE